MWEYLHDGLIYASRSATIRFICVDWEQTQGGVAMVPTALGTWCGGLRLPSLLLRTTRQTTTTRGDERCCLGWLF